MGLLTGSPVWAHYRTDRATNPAAILGTNVTAGASNLDGTAVSILSTLDNDVDYLVIGITGFRTIGSVGDTLLDILIDPAGGTSWAVLIDNLIAGYTPPLAAGIPPPLVYQFPIFIPSGAALGARARTRHTVGPTGRVTFDVFGGNKNPDFWWSGQNVYSVGADDTISGGQAHTPGNSGAFSTWTNLGSTLTAACRAIQFGVQMSNQSAVLAQRYTVQFGVSSVQFGPSLYYNANTSEEAFVYPSVPIFCDLAAGTQLMVRATCSATAQAIQVAAYPVS